MAGRITKSEEQLRPDPRYGSKVLSRFINCVMRDGKKAVAQRVVYDALAMIDRGEISDAKTVAGLLATDRRLRLEASIGD